MKKLTLILFLAAGALTATATAADTPAASPAALPEIDHMVYLSFLPEPEDLMADAKAGGLTVLRLDKTADRVVVTYKYPNGHTATLGYALLSSARNTDRVKERPVEVVERTTTVVEREPEIVYVERPYYPSTRVVYRDRWDDFWPPLVLGLGIGYISGHHSHHHSYRGHGHYRWRH